MGPVPGVWCVWADGSSMVRFCPGTGSLTLTVRQGRRPEPGGRPEDAVGILRERLADDSVLKLVRARFV